MKKESAVPQKLIDDVFARWKDGERLPALTRLVNAAGHPVTLGAVRYWLIRACGGPGEYANVAAEREAAHPLERKGPPRREFTPVDDSNVPVITSGRVKDGWGSERILVNERAEDVLVAPDGTRYVHAQSNHNADLIYKGKYGERRWRKLEGSALARQVKREEKLVQVGAAQRERKTIRRKK